MRKPLHDEKIIALLNEKGPKNAADIGTELNITNGFVYVILSRMLKAGKLKRDSKKNYRVNNEPAKANEPVKKITEKPASVFDSRIEVLWGEVDAIDQRLDYLMAVKMHLVNRINEYKDAAARSTGSR